MTPAPLCLFLCTGNYYRSRFAEEYFNHHAAQRGLAWTATSRALHARPWETTNRGPMAAHTLQALVQRGIAPRGAQRMPAPVTPADWTRADRVIAACEREHRPMVERDHAAQAAQVTYWEIEDEPLWPPERAIAALVARLDSLLQGLARPSADPATRCPVCGGPLVQIRCKCVCQSPTCVNRIVYSCCEF